MNEMKKYHERKGLSGALKTKGGCLEWICYGKETFFFSPNRSGGYIQSVQLFKGWLQF